MPATLATPLQFLTSLLSTPPFHHPSSPPLSPHPLLPINPITKPLLLTLHCLFPSELLPALDLLDRHLVTRFVVDQPVLSAANHLTVRKAHCGRDSGAVYYVRSSHRSRRVQDGVGTSYEVRTKAWNCTCPAFTFAAFSYEDGDYEGAGGEEDENKEGIRDQERLGGLTLGNQVPICKHLLACVLIERCASLEAYVEKREIGTEEMAGWAAGWGG